MWSPGSVLCVSFDDDGIFIECIGEREGGLRFLPGVQIVGLLSTKPIRERAPDVCSDMLAIVDCLCTFQPTWYNDILVVSHKVLKNSEWRGFDIDISPIHPAVSGSQSRAEQPVACLGHRLTTTSLRCKTVTRLDVLVDLLSEILLHNRDLAKCFLGVRVGLQLLQLLCQERNGVVLGVSDKKCQIDEVVRISQVLQVAEEHWQMRRRISKRGAYEYPLFPLPPPCSALYIVEVVISYGLEL